MLIHGLQKMTLLDYPGCVACTVFLGGCDFRCPYCHNFELVDGSAEPVTDDKAFLDFLGKRKGLLDGVAITGGEPLMRNDLDFFIRKIKELGFKVKLDTNGYHPARLKNLIDEKLLDYIAMDIKNSFPKYALTAGLDKADTSLIQNSIVVIMNSNIDYEFRTTVVEEFHSKEDFEQIGTAIKGAKAYYLQPYTQRDTVPCRNLHAPSEETMMLYAEAAGKFVENTQLRGM